MSVLQRSFVGAGVLSFLLAFPACNKTTTVAPPPVEAGSVPIALTAGSNGNCLQNSVEGGNVVMGTPGVTWSSPIANTSLEIHFAPGCPFSQCDFGPSTSPIPSRTSSAPRGTTVPYSSIKIGGSSCSVGSDGIVMR